MDFVTVQIYKEGEYLGSDTGGTTALVRLVVIDRRTSIRVRNLRTRWLRRLKPKTTTHNAQRTGVRGRRKLRHPAPPPAPKPISDLRGYLVPVKNFLSTTTKKTRHGTTQHQHLPPPTPTTTTATGR
jgi:hypothetical protein